MVIDAPPQDRLKGNAALAALPPADGRSHQPDFAPFERDEDEPDPNDSTTILQGNKAFTGNGLTSARGGVNANTFAQYEQAKRKEIERQAEESRQLERLAVWGAQRTVIGGVEMTNSEAQNARQRVIDNGDHYADWAVRQGYIRADQKDEFIETMRLQKDLEEKRGRGTITPEEERKAEAIRRSDMARGLDAATAQAYQERSMDLSATTRRETGNEALRRTVVPVIAANEAVFQSYDAAKPKAVPTPTRPAAAVSAMGLDL